MQAQRAIPQEDTDIGSEENCNLNLEIETQQAFRPHYGNNFIFCFKDGEPQITIGPHWPLSLVLIAGIIIGTYYSNSLVLIHKSQFYQVLSIYAAIQLILAFLWTALKNPGIQTAWSMQPMDEGIKPFKLFGYCKACKIPKLQTTIHCFDCDICVKEQDHHCPWTGKCIGSGNLRQFQLFLYSLLQFFVLNMVLVMI